MLTPVFDAVMERRARRLVEQVRDALPEHGPVLDLGSGTGHVAARLTRQLRLDIVTADVSDIHVTGPAPVLVGDGALPFADGMFSAVLLLFMLAYPRDPGLALRESARVARSKAPIILVQTLSSGRLGRAWHRTRELLWTIVAFHVSKLAGYVPSTARFAMHTMRFYTAAELERDVHAAGLRIRSRCERPVLPGRALVVATWTLVRDD